MTIPKVMLLMVLLFITNCEGQKNMNYNELTSEEEKVIIHKGTERPFSGEYWNHKAKGIYVCRQCNFPLYKSDDKFDSHCGWPSFDDEFPEAVKKVKDADGIRTEITCTNCNGHLGHVFYGERFTEKNTRHCVNSLSIKFIPAEDLNGNYKKAYFAGGCFWGVEHLFKDVKGVINTKVGYMGGNKANPTYEEVCYNKTGHAETLEVVYNPEEVTFEKLAKLFFEIHDFSQINRQGPDVGDQYRSEIFITDEEQKKISEKLIKVLEEKGYKVATRISNAGIFWKAEDYHQKYYEKTGKRPYCHFYQKKFD